jgi:hypothetical protein
MLIRVAWPFARVVEFQTRVRSDVSVSDNVSCMEQAQIVRLVLVAIFVALLFQGSVLEAILEAINNFRGGRLTPSHPLPAEAIKDPPKQQLPPRWVVEKVLGDKLPAG